MSETIEIKLLGKDYKVACEDGERESLLAAVTMLEGRLGEFGKVARGGGERVAMMAALDIAHELTLARDRSSGDAGSHGAVLESVSIQRRIDSIEARVAAALEQNQSLF